MKDKISIRDAMVSNVITIEPNKTVDTAAKLMKKHDIGGLVVIKGKNPIGMITERDFLDIVAANKKPSEIKIEKAMSTPLVSISPNQSIVEAAKLMSKSKIRKLPVKDKGKLIGILTAEDIVKVAPREIELLLELASIKKADMEEGEFHQSPTAGECEVCGNFSDYLHQVEEAYVCGECKRSLEAE